MIGDTPIPEEEVTAYVETYRLAEGDYGSDEDWATYLSDNGRTAAELREAVIEHYAEKLAMLDDAERRGVALPSDDEVNAEIEKRHQSYVANADYFSGTYGVNSWDEFKQYTYVTDYNMRLSVTLDLLEDAYREAVESELDVDDSQYEEFLYSFGIYYHTKNFAHILCGDKTAADQALAALKDGREWDEVVSEYSQDEQTKENGGKVGWDILYPSLSLDETEALRPLSPGDISDAIELSDGRYEIVKCTDEFSVPENRESFSLDAVPEEIIEYLRGQFIDDAYDDYVKGLVGDDTLHVNEMPEGLSYDVPTGDES